MERRWRRSSIIPWILLFERLNTGALQKLFDSYKHFKHIPSSLNTIEQISRIINRLATIKELLRYKIEETGYKYRDDKSFPYE